MPKVLLLPSILARIKTVPKSTVLARIKTVVFLLELDSESQIQVRGSRPFPSRVTKQVIDGLLTGQQHWQPNLSPVRAVTSQPGRPGIIMMQPRPLGRQIGRAVVSICPTQPG